MTAHIIALHTARPEAFLCRPLYTMKWVTASGIECSKSTRDAEVIRRQLNSCRRGRLSATVKADGRLCGGVLEEQHPDGSRSYSCHFEGESWA